MNRETPEAYAQRRANETRHAYLVTTMGHAFVMTATNRKNLEQLGGVKSIYRPQRKGR